MSRIKWFKWVLGLCLGSLWGAPMAFAVVDAYRFTSVEQEHRFFELVSELRCPKCQNQTIGDSNAPIAQDLRREVYRMVSGGADKQQVIAFMHQRYGEFVLYKPPMSGVNWLLWLGPLGLLMIGLAVVFRVVRAHQKPLDANHDAH